ncbi:Xanthotoxin 5-hydroxylase CYP82C4 [Sesamum alatum]|uniref:Flavonoid-6-hydroxylase n=1 Tax=Sesamum alatum TaxID=300844 RepID=A0AAE2D0B1_9LAMI|nr:Xanthotoxin 5-hydroxylase CYP82C4 [Sesamum alatum]
MRPPCPNNICHFNFLMIINMMSIFTHLLALSGLLALLLLYKLWRKNHQNNSNKGKTPEPSGAWPLVGHLHLLGGQVPLYRIFGGLADEYGPVFGLRLGLHNVLVVSSWEAVKECFTTNDKILAKRPDSRAGAYLGFTDACFGFTADGPYWREMRKLALQELLSPRRLETLKHVRESEIDTAIKELYKEHSGKEVDISEWLVHITSNMIMLMVAGKRHTNGTQSAETVEVRSVREHIKEFIDLFGQFTIADALPFPPFSWIDFQGHNKSMKRITKGLSTIIERWIDIHIRGGCQSASRNEQDLIDVMLSKVDDRFTRFGHTRETIIKATVVNLIMAGSDTTAIHMTWVLSLLLNNRRVLQRAQEEIDKNVGKERWVQESDIKNLVYLQAIVKEAFRLYPPGPLSLPHEAMEDCRVSGYHVPKGTCLIFNLWKLHRDPRIWSEPDNFVPERFLTSHVKVDLKGQHYEFIPFGSGRRSCPGITSAMQVADLTLARLLQGFDLTTPSNIPIDMTEGRSANLPKATPLKIVITPRLSSEFYPN